MKVLTGELPSWLLIKTAVRYSRMWNYGVCSIDLTENDEKVYLAVAATPSVYEPVNAKAGYRSIITYPYEISVVGATPAAVPAGHGVPVNVSGTRHPNGGGFVASTAVVEDSVYVAENAAVLGLARVTVCTHRRLCDRS